MLIARHTIVMINTFLEENADDVAVHLQRAVHNVFCNFFFVKNRLSYESHFFIYNSYSLFLLLKYLYHLLLLRRLLLSNFLKIGHFPWILEFRTCKHKHCSFLLHKFILIIKNHALCIIVYIFHLFRVKNILLNRNKTFSHFDKWESILFFTPLLI